MGNFDEEESANALRKYIITKFARSMLGVLKVTQNGNKPVWRYIPMQDFSLSSNINWSTSIANIDRQLYKKYGLSQEEIDFIERVDCKIKLNT
jgi:type II restriction enzyme